MWSATVFVIIYFTLRVATPYSLVEVYPPSWGTRLDVYVGLQGVPQNGAATSSE